MKRILGIVNHATHLPIHGKNGTDMLQARKKARHKPFCTCVAPERFTSVRPKLQLMRFRLLFCAVPAILCARLHAQSTTGIYVNPSNNVGIGTTSPQAALDVNGDINQTVGTGADTIHGADKRATRAIGQCTLGSDSAGSSAFVGMKTSVFAGQGSEAANQADIEFFTWGNSYAGSREVMRIRSSGKVGIGTTSPVFNLHTVGVVASDQGSGTYVTLGQDPGGSSSPTTYGGMYFDAGKNLRMEALSGGVAWRNIVLQGQGSGNVGIGTTSPGTKLEIDQNGTAYNIGYGGWWSGFRTSAQTGVFGFQQNDRACFGLGGNVYNIGFSANSMGIMNGSTTPEDIYLINQNGPSPGFLVLKASGNVGIGTASPIAPLDVSSILHVGGNTNPSLPGQGGYVGWNALTGGTGEMDFMNQQGLGSGGFAFFNSNSNSVGTAIVTIDGNGTIYAPSFVSATQVYADFVFKPGYKLEPLSDVETAIKKDGHLPGIPSEKEAKAHGINLADMQVKLLQKIEELTLHQIEQEKQLDEQNGRIENLEKENAELRGKLTK